MAVTSVVAVTGVVQDQSHGGPVSSVNVVLGIDKNQGGELLTDPSNSEGIYNLSRDGIDVTVDDLYVWTEDPYLSRPQRAKLDPAVQGVRRSKPQPLRVVSNTSSPLAYKEVIFIILCIQETEALKVQLGLQSREDGFARAQKLTQQNLARFLEDDKAVIASMIGEVERQRNVNLLPSFLMTKEQILHVVDSAEFKEALGKHRNLQRDVGEYLQGRMSARPEIASFFLNADASLYKPEWFAGADLAKQMSSELRKLEPERISFAIDILSCRRITPRSPQALSLKVTGDGIAPKDLVGWVGSNREAGRYLLYKKLMLEREIPEQEKARLRAEGRFFRSVIQAEN